MRNLQDAVWRPSSGKTANDAITPSTYPTLLKALFSDSEIKQLLEHANSEEIKGKLKSESKQLVEEGGAFGFVRCRRYLLTATE